MRLNKKGGWEQLLWVPVIIFLFSVFWISYYNWNTERGGEVISNAITRTIDLFGAVLKPTIGALLGIEGKDPGVQTIMVLSFLLIFIVVLGTMNSVDIFGSQKHSRLFNVLIGIIVALIGVRFMPDDMWISLTAPSSAFAAVVFVGLPFAALFFVTYAFKSNLVRKIVWIFFVVFLSYIIFREGNDFSWIYGIFLFLSLIMMFFDKTVRSFIYREKLEAQAATREKIMLSNRIIDLEKQLEEREGRLSDARAKGDKELAKTLGSEVKEVKKELTRLREELGRVS